MWAKSREGLTFLNGDFLERTNMQKHSIFAKAAATVLAGTLALALTSFAGLAVSEFEGKWKVEDTEGTPFEITLSADGSAQANRPGKPMNGTWKEEGGVAVISWDTGWTTKISKQGNTYKQSVWDKDTPLSNAPMNTSGAEKGG
jgi:hypothetical protein